MIDFNWRALTEAIAAISIVASLVFVGLEIRQSSAIARMEAYQAYSISIAENSRDITHDPEFALVLFESIQKARTEYTDTERSQLFTHYFSVINLYHSLYQSVIEGILPEEHLSIIENDPQFASPVFNSIWQNLQVYYGESFVSYFSTEVLDL